MTAPARITNQMPIIRARLVPTWHHTWLLQPKVLAARAALVPSHPDQNLDTPRGYPMWRKGPRHTNGEAAPGSQPQGNTRIPPMQIAIRLRSGLPFASPSQGLSKKTLKPQANPLATFAADLRRKALLQVTANLGRHLRKFATRFTTKVLRKRLSWIKAVFGCVCPGGCGGALDRAASRQ